MPEKSRCSSIPVIPLVGYTYRSLKTPGVMFSQVEITNIDMIEIYIRKFGIQTCGLIIVRGVQWVSVLETELLPVDLSVTHVHCTCTLYIIRRRATFQYFTNTTFDDCST